MSQTKKPAVAKASSSDAKPAVAKASPAIASQPAVVAAPKVEQLAEKNQATIAAAQNAAKAGAAASATKPAGKPTAKPAAKPAAKPVAQAAATQAAKPIAAKHDAPATSAPQVVAASAKAEKPSKPVKSSKPVKAAKPTKVAKAEGKPEKPRKPKLVRDSFAMPESEYGRIAELKKRMQALGNPVKKSELLRGGIAALAALNDAELKAVMGRVERIKTGRPAK